MEIFRLSGTFAELPPAGEHVYSLYYATDQDTVYRSTGSAWIERSGVERSWLGLTSAANFAALPSPDSHRNYMALTDDGKYYESFPGSWVDITDEITGGRAVLTRGFSVESPTSSENLSLGWVTDADLTISQVTVVLRGASPSVTWRLDHGANRGSGTPIWTESETTDVGTGEVRTSFSDPTIPSGHHIWLVTTAIGGTPTQLSATVFFSYD